MLIRYLPSNCFSMPIHDPKCASPEVEKTDFFFKFVDRFLNFYFGGLIFSWCVAAKALFFCWFPYFWLFGFPWGAVQSWCGSAPPLCFWFASRSSPSLRRCPAFSCFRYLIFVGSAWSLRLLLHCCLRSSSQMWVSLLRGFTPVFLRSIWIMIVSIRFLPNSSILPLIFLNSIRVGPLWNLQYSIYGASVADWFLKCEHLVLKFRRIDEKWPWGCF